MILRPPKSTLWKAAFNPNSQATQFYNVVEDLAQAPCAMSTLEVLQSCPTQRKNLLTALGALDPDNTNLITSILRTISLGYLLNLLFILL